MTRKHFKLIADVLREAHENVSGSDLTQQHYTIDRLTEEFAAVLKGTNANFNKDKFMRAAGFSQG